MIHTIAQAFLKKTFFILFSSFVVLVEAEKDPKIKNAISYVRSKNLRMYNLVS